MMKNKTGDSCGKIPNYKTNRDTLEGILSIANDKRGHVLLDEHCNWLELKMKVIAKIARQRLKQKG
jgi:hypothetical protein